jgi:hypothetical protein
MLFQDAAGTVSVAESMGHHEWLSKIESSSPLPLIVDLLQVTIPVYEHHTTSLYPVWKVLEMLVGPMVIPNIVDVR